MIWVNKSQFSWWKRCIVFLYRHFINELYIPNKQTRVTKLGHGIELNKKHNGYGEWVELSGPNSVPTVVHVEQTMI